MANDTGNDANHTYNGTGSADKMLGLGGNDSLSGGEGNDCIRGGQGIDRLTGGSGNDRFTYDALSESPGSSQQFDYIHDFVPGQDKIDLRNIDAGSGLAGDQALNFLGQGLPLSGQPGQVWVNTGGGMTYVQADANGDAVADFVVALVGSLQITADDFML